MAKKSLLEKVEKKYNKFSDLAEESQDANLKTCLTFFEKAKVKLEFMIAQHGEDALSEDDKKQILSFFKDSLKAAKANDLPEAIKMLGTVAGFLGEKFSEEE